MPRPAEQPLPADPSPYQVLGVPRDATTDQIRRAFRAKAKAHHPDVNAHPGADQAFALVKRAYELLKDPARRRALDDPQPPTHPGRPHYHWSNIAAPPAQSTASDSSDFDELYEALFQTRIDQAAAAASKRHAKKT